MPTRLQRLSVKNYRALADVSTEMSPVNVLFGPNGSGKSTFLDTIWFFRDCAVRGVEIASTARSHGIGLLWDGADDGEQISVSLATDEVNYELRFGLSSGRIEPFAGERLLSIRDDKKLIDRTVGSDKANLWHDNVKQHVTLNIREPEKLSLGLYLDFNPTDRPSDELDRLLHFVRYYHSRSILLHRLKTQGSESSHEIKLWERCENAWSVLRNLHDKKSVDRRYDTIMDFMRESFPSFDGLLLEQTGPNSVYAHFHEKGHRSAIQASGVSDGHIQMLLLLTALFSEGSGQSVLLFDEPEISLHPWALAVFAKAAKAASTEWNKQILIATHSPVLLSQFEVDQVLQTESIDGRTRLTRLSEMPAIHDLLGEYATGSLFMSQVIGAQTKELESSDGGAEIVAHR